MRCSRVFPEVWGECIFEGAEVRFCSAFHVGKLIVRPRAEVFPDVPDGNTAIQPTFSFEFLLALLAAVVRGKREDLDGAVVLASES